MVESFMLAANETVAAHFNKANVPFLYRIHETPKEEKIKRFFELLSAIGVEATGSTHDITPKMLQNILKKLPDARKKPLFRLCCFAQCNKQNILLNRLDISELQQPTIRILRLRSDVILI